MSVKSIAQALTEQGVNDAVVGKFLPVWKIVVKLLKLFSVTSQTPVFVYLNDHFVWQSDQSLHPNYCQVLLANDSFRRRCTLDGLRRAREGINDQSQGTTLCHAGVRVYRRVVQIHGVGSLAILFGSELANDFEAVARREKTVERLRIHGQNFASDAARGADEAHSIYSSKQLRRNAKDISNVIQFIAQQSIDFHLATMSMSHEVANVFLVVSPNLRRVRGLSNLSSDLREDVEDMIAQCELGSYLVDNFLRHLSGSSPVDRDKLPLIDVEAALNEIVALYRRVVKQKGIDIEVEKPLDLPRIRGSAVEIRRALNNSMSNAFKYSYHSVRGVSRVIRVYSKVPYDPGFADGDPRFAICIENYGLGLYSDELRRASEPGFRGVQARGEVPIGSGLGISQIDSIQKLHGGHWKIRSKLVHSDESGDTFLTTLELIYPYIRQG